MKSHVSIFLVLALAACAQTPKTAPVAVAPVSEVTAPPTPLAAPDPVPAVDPALLAAVQSGLRALGYATGKGDVAQDPVFQKAVVEFEKDQGLPQDGRVTAELAERIRLLRAQLPRPPVASYANAVFVYDDGAVGRQALGLSPSLPAGMSSDAPANFMLPLRPGAQGSFHVGHRAKDGSFAPVAAVTCKAGRLTSADLPVGQLNIIAVDCHGDGPQSLQWRSVYSTSLGLFVRQENGATARNLIAVRPQTGNWPLAARTGLDWATTHTLETPPSAVAIPWSSTGVASHFEIKASAQISGQDAGLTGHAATQSCRRFDIMQSGAPVIHYPGIACENAAGAWFLPGTTVQFAAPASGITGGSPPLLRSAQK